MNSLMDEVVNLFLILAGLGFLGASFFARDFDFKQLGSQKPGKPAPAWLARPFSFWEGIPNLGCLHVVEAAIAAGA
jgi:hypothetical protein